MEEYDELLTLWQRAGLLIKPRGRDSRPALERQVRLNRVAILGAFLEGHLMGSVLVSDDGRKGWINRLAVDPAQRRQGLGARLIRAAEEELRERGLALYAALIEQHNVASLRLFEREGYRPFNGVVYLSKRESPDV